MGDLHDKKQGRKMQQFVFNNKQFGTDCYRKDPTVRAYFIIELNQDIEVNYLISYFLKQKQNSLRHSLVWRNVILLCIIYPNFYQYAIDQFLFVSTASWPFDVFSNTAFFLFLFSNSSLSFSRLSFFLTSHLSFSLFFLFLFSFFLLLFILSPCLLSINIMTSNNCQVQYFGETGSGLFALKSFKKGEIVYVCQVQAYDVPNGSHPSQVDMNKWVLFSLLGRSINHSCDPNCGIGFDGANWSYVAFKDINKGDQLTYDYAMANYKVENFPNCLCESSKCRREIKGFQSLPQERKKQYKGFFAPYLEKMVQDLQ